MNSIGTKTIDTERLILRRFELSDTASVFRNWASDENVQKNYGEPVYPTEEAVTALLQEYISSYEDNDCYRWAVIERSSGECIGQAAFFLVDTSGHFAEIEYCIGSSFQKKGYATEATRALIKYGFEEIGLNKVQICVRPSNMPSRKVIEKCGFCYEGTLREYFYIDDHYEDRMYFSILKSEYEN
ncbi:MAG: GNAT family N-acetyltransferase [Clostridiales bacterium]|nr:GNAT family N-acetyltransferase [Clostridiales bacterium]